MDHLYDRIADPENLRLAFLKASRGKRAKAEVLAYAARLNENLRRLRDELLAGEVRVGDYHTFTVHDPKERDICAASFPERVVHHAIMNTSFDARPAGTAKIFPETARLRKRMALRPMDGSGLVPDTLKRELRTRCL